MEYTKRLVISRSKATRNPYNDPLQCISIGMPHLPDLSDQGQARWGFGVTVSKVKCKFKLKLELVASNLPDLGS
jgi:hypothetical protein